jgi:hypothetical protein
MRTGSWAISGSWPVRPGICGGCPCDRSNRVPPAFCDELTTPLDTSTGTATLSDLENHFGATVRTDQPYLSETLRGPRDAVAARQTA